MPSEGSALNSMLSASLGPYIGSGLYPHYRFYPTDLNPADGPTPGKPPPLATRPLPEWWDDLCCGRFEGFDDWMRSLPSWAPGPDFSHVRCDVSPEPPSVVDEVDCAPSGQLGLRPVRPQLTVNHHATDILPDFWMSGHWGFP